MLTFDPDTHTYLDGAERYRSVGELIKQYVKPFPKDFIADKVAKRDEREVEEVLTEWQLKGDMGRDYGNAIDKAIELWVNYGETPKQSHLNDAVTAFQARYDREDCYAQIVAYSAKYKLAGTIDIIHVPTRTIVDVKANGEVETKNRGYFLPPLDDLPNNKLNRYRLQLSLYQFLLQDMGKETDNLRVEYWNGYEFETFDLEPITNLKELI